MVTLLAVGVSFFISETLMAPDGPRFQDGQEVVLDGQLTCLPHHNTDGPVTLECAMGFRDSEGDYYGVLDNTPDQIFISGVEHGKDIKISGIFTAETSPRYQQMGVIEVKGLIE